MPVKCIVTLPAEGDEKKLLDGVKSAVARPIALAAATEGADEDVGSAAAAVGGGGLHYPPRVAAYLRGGVIRRVLTPAASRPSSPGRLDSVGDLTHSRSSNNNSSLFYPCNSLNDRSSFEHGGSATPSAVEGLRYRHNPYGAPLSSHGSPLLLASSGNASFTDPSGGGEAVLGDGYAARRCTIRSRTALSSSRSTSQCSYSLYYDAQGGVATMATDPNPCAPHQAESHFLTPVSAVATAGEEGLADGAAPSSKRRSLCSTAATATGLHVPAQLTTLLVETSAHCPSSGNGSIAAVSTNSNNPYVGVRVMPEPTPSVQGTVQADRGGWQAATYTRLQEANTHPLSSPFEAPLMQAPVQKLCDAAADEADSAGVVVAHSRNGNGSAEPSGGYGTVMGPATVAVPVAHAASAEVTASTTPPYTTAPVHPSPDSLAPPPYVEASWGPGHDGYATRGVRGPTAPPFYGRPPSPSPQQQQQPWGSPSQPPSYAEATSTATSRTGSVVEASLSDFSRNNSSVLDGTHRYSSVSDATVVPQLLTTGLEHADGQSNSIRAASTAHEDAQRRRWYAPPYIAEGEVAHQETHPPYANHLPPPPPYRDPRNTAIASDRHAAGFSDAASLRSAFGTASAFESVVSSPPEAPDPQVPQQGTSTMTAAPAPRPEHEGASREVPFEIGAPACGSKAGETRGDPVAEDAEEEEEEGEEERASALPSDPATTAQKKKPRKRSGRHRNRKIKELEDLPPLQHMKYLPPPPPVPPAMPPLAPKVGGAADVASGTSFDTYYATLVRWYTRLLAAEDDFVTLPAAAVTSCTGGAVSLAELPAVAGAAAPASITFPLLPDNTVRPSVSSLSSAWSLRSPQAGTVSPPISASSAPLFSQSSLPPTCGGGGEVTTRCPRINLYMPACDIPASLRHCDATLEAAPTPEGDEGSADAAANAAATRIHVSNVLGAVRWARDLETWWFRYVFPHVDHPRRQPQIFLPTSPSQQPIATVSPPGLTASLTGGSGSSAAYDYPYGWPSMPSTGAPYGAYGSNLMAPTMTGGGYPATMVGSSGGGPAPAYTALPLPPPMHPGYLMGMYTRY